MRKLSAISHQLSDKNNKGFTLVELLVVVAIIAILSVIGLTIFSGAQANARDARRRADIDAISKVLETTRSPGSIYYYCLPATGSTACTGGTPSGFSGGVVPTDTTTAKYCIKTVSGAALPSDPLPANWVATEACDDASWTQIPTTGLPAGTAPFTTGANITGWKVCARLETNPTTVYCKPSSQ